MNIFKWKVKIARMQNVSTVFGSSNTADAKDAVGLIDFMEDSLELRLVFNLKRQFEPVGPGLR
jgi:hypothetical protein